MSRLALLLAMPLAIALALPASALSPEGREFIGISQRLENTQCEKRKLRRAYVVARAEGDAAKQREAKERFDALDRDPGTRKLERRLGELQRRMTDGKGAIRDPEDLDSISAQQRRAFYNCE